MSCQICVEVCPFEADQNGQGFRLSKRERFDQLCSAKSNFKIERVYHKIHPLEAAAVDKNLADAAAAAEAKKRRRRKQLPKLRAAKAAAASAPTAVASPESAAGSTSAPGEAPPETAKPKQPAARALL